MEKLKQLAKLRNQALKEFQQALMATQTKDYSHWLIEQSVFYLYSIDWEYYFEADPSWWAIRLWLVRN